MPRSLDTCTFFFVLVPFFCLVLLRFIIINPVSIRNRFDTYFKRTRHFWLTTKMQHTILCLVPIMMTTGNIFPGDKLQRGRMIWSKQKTDYREEYLFTEMKYMPYIPSYNNCDMIVLCRSSIQEQPRSEAIYGAFIEIGKCSSFVVHYSFIASCLFLSKFSLRYK